MGGNNGEWSRFGRRVVAVRAGVMRSNHQRIHWRFQLLQLLGLGLRSSKKLSMNFLKMCCNPIFGSTKIFSNVILFLLLFIKIQKIKKKENSKIYIFLESTASFRQNRVHQVNTGQTMSTRVKNKFRVKAVIFDQNRVHRVNPGQTMSTRVKNEFRAVSGQTRHF